MVTVFHSGGAGVMRCLLFAGAVASAPGVGAAQTSELIHYEVTGRFASSRLRESSGVAVSRTQAGVLWTHNDSGDKPRIFATDLAGRHLGTFDVRGAKSKDWEDIALGPCMTTNGSCLYIADTGDNEHRRKRVFIYVVPEPSVDRDDNRTRKTEKALRLEVTYPDGPHDVEAIAVSPEGDVYLFSKGRRGSIIAFRIPGVAGEGVERTAIVVDTLPIAPRPTLGRWVTGAALDSSGTRLAIRTYTEIFFFDRGPEGQISFTGRSCWLGARQRSGEAIDFLDGDSLVLTTEANRGRPGILAVVRCS